MRSHQSLVVPSSWGRNKQWSRKKCVTFSDIPAGDAFPVMGEDEEVLYPEGDSRPPTSFKTGQ